MGKSILRKPYLTYLTDEQWEVSQQMLPAAKSDVAQECKNSLHLLFQRSY